FFEVEIVHDMRDAIDRWRCQTEACDERLERAAMSRVAEFHTIHVEGNAGTRGRRRFREAEARFRIDEPADEPCGRHQIDSGPGPRDPQALLIAHGVEALC